MLICSCVSVHKSLNRLMTYSLIVLLLVFFFFFLFFPPFLFPLRTSSRSSAVWYSVLLLSLYVTTVIIFVYTEVFFYFLSILALSVCWRSDLTHYTLDFWCIVFLFSCVQCLKFGNCKVLNHCSFFP